MGRRRGQLSKPELQQPRGKARWRCLAGPLVWSEEAAPQIREAFQIANNWRDAHAYPMRSVRYQLMWYMRNLELAGVTVARLKRMQAIRRKLRRINLNLNQIQDLGGCRAILSSISEVNTLATTLCDRSRHELRAENDYIKKPKEDGYRSRHLMFNYCGKGDAAAHNGRRIEVQIRTRVQHSWATAVEAVGLFRGEDLKSEKNGSPEWLRLFQLMSAEFAVMEGSPEGEHVPSHSQRVAEIIDLNRRLKAANTLDNLSNAVKWTDIAVQTSVSRPTYYLISYDNATNQVSVSPYFMAKAAVNSYDNAEFADNKSGEDTKNVVLVEADKIDNLKLAYPNYFGDVQLFRASLKTIIGGKPLREYKVKPQELAPSRIRQSAITDQWLRRGRFGKPKGA